MMMRKQMIFAGIAATALTVAGHAQASIFAGFDGGNSTAVVDGYEGMAGDGWAGPWTLSTSDDVNSSVTVQNTNPLNSSGNYLKASIDSLDSTANNHLLMLQRQYTNVGSFDRTEAHTISFDFRPDVALTTSTHGGERYTIYGNVSGGGSIDTSNNATWLIMAVAADGNSSSAGQGLVRGNWGFLTNPDPGTTAGGGDMVFVDTGMAMVAGTVYSFDITVNPDNRSYIASVTDGVDTFTSGTLYFRNQDTTATNAAGDFIRFSARHAHSSSPNLEENYGFSVDNLSIVPEPASVVLMGMGGLLLLRRRRIDH